MNLYEERSLYSIANEIGALLPTLAQLANKGEIKVEKKIGEKGRLTMFTTTHNVLHALARSGRTLRKKHANVLEKYKYND